MSGLARPGRSGKAMYLGLALALSLITAGVAVAASTALTYTPQKADQITNIDVLRQQIKNYYGSPTAGSGPNGGWSTPLALDSNYAREACSVAKDGANWLNAQASVPNGAIVLDVDDTTLTTFNYELFSNWDYNPSTNAVFVGLGNPPASSSTFTGNMFPATPCMVDLVTQAKSMGYAVFFITGRGDSQHQATIANLVDDAAAGFANIDTVTYSGATVPEIDAGYPMPTAIDHGSFTDGLFTKPSVGNYPDYLNKPEFCADAIAASKSCGTVAYKSGTRAYIESMGYDIVASFGDQYSDLNGGYADRTFKMPNTNYYLP
jgi:predicted secreted acid phosphatase